MTKTEQVVVAFSAIVMILAGIAAFWHGGNGKKK